MTAFEAFLAEGRGQRGEAATLEDLWACYRLFLAREPDPQGFEAYAQVVARGIPARELAYTFLTSPEFAACTRSPPDPDVSKAATLGGELFVPTADAVVGEAILSTGTYEPHVTAAMQAVLKPGMKVADIGANIGWFTFLAADAVGDAGHVWAFEPLARNVRLLAANQSLRGAGNVTILPFGASDAEGLLSLMAMGSIASSRRMRIEDVTTVNALELTYARRIDDAIPACDLFKIDIDGFDAVAVAGAHRVVGGCAHVFAELTPSGLQEHSGVTALEYLRGYVALGFTRFEALRHDGSVENFGLDLERLAGEPQRRGLTHLDLHITR